ncbi:hypothetical protein BC833DRAFT_626634 [Globomyces pollinis-pini]|nr:hypothetical protein BC833DRAFT_626634 [Globomyces pollinis-pini]
MVQKIAEKERTYKDSVCFGVTSNSFEKLSNIDHLLAFNPDKWLRDINKVLLIFLTTFFAPSKRRKEVKRKQSDLILIASIENLYKYKNTKYVGTLQFNTNLLVYQKCHSRAVLNIMQLTGAGGCYNFILKWLSNLNTPPQYIPQQWNVCVQLDNDQVVEKLYTETSNNKQPVSIVTSLMAIKMKYNSNLQTNIHKPISSINSHINFNNHVESLKSNFKELKTNAFESKNFDKIFKLNKKLNQKLVQTYPSIETLVLDPIPINPNSENNIKTILRHIRNIANVIPSDRRLMKVGHVYRNWIFVGADGIPCATILKIQQQEADAYDKDKTFIKEFDWIVLIIGDLHIEMNMMKTFLKTYWEYNLKEFAEIQGYKSPKQLHYFQSGIDTHKTYQALIEIFFKQSLLDLHKLYHQERHGNTLDSTFVEWGTLKATRCESFKIFWTQITEYLLSIYLFKKAVRARDTRTKILARTRFADLFWSSSHPYYSKLELANTLQQKLLHLGILRCFDDNDGGVQPD